MDCKVAGRGGMAGFGLGKEWDSSRMYSTSRYVYN